MDNLETYTTSYKYYNELCDIFYHRTMNEPYSHKDYILRTFSGVDDSYCKHLKEKYNTYLDDKILKEEGFISIKNENIF